MLTVRGNIRTSPQYVLQSHSSCQQWFSLIYTSAITHHSVQKQGCAFCFTCFVELSANPAFSDGAVTFPLVRIMYKLPCCKDVFGTEIIPQVCHCGFKIFTERDVMLQPMDFLPPKSPVKLYFLPGKNGNWMPCHCCLDWLRQRKKNKLSSALEVPILPALVILGRYLKWNRISRRPFMIL